MRGKNWTKSEDERLLRGRRIGVTIKRLSQELDRTPTSIAQRLFDLRKKLGEELVPKYRAVVPRAGNYDFQVSVILSSTLKDKAAARATSRGQTLSSYIRSVLEKDLL